MSELTATEPLDRGRHRADEFRCGVDSLDRWLRAYAGQSQRRDAARTFVTADTRGRVAGYYTLVAAEVRVDAATGQVGRGMSAHFPVPVALLARLAIDRDHQGQGLGRSLLLDALQRVVRASKEIGVRAITVNAIDDRATSFYRHFGFEPSPLASHTLMVPLSLARRVIVGT